VGQGVITRIVRQKRAQERLSLYVDGRFLCGLDEVAFHELSLKEGDRLSSQRQQELKAQSLAGKAKDAALRLLAIRPRSRKELAQRLQKKGYGVAEVDAVIQELQEKGLLDDLRFARLYAEHRLTGRQIGKRMLLVELLQKGIDRQVAQSVVNETTGNDREKIEARGFAEKKLRLLVKGTALQRKKKLYDALFRRGFSPEVVREVLRDLLKKSVDDDAE
jgi:regulatory protein